jgi:O-antigen ligase
MFQLLSLTPLFASPFLSVLADKAATVSMIAAVVGMGLYLISQGINPFLGLRSRCISLKRFWPLIGMIIIALLAHSLISIVPERSFKAAIKLTVLLALGFVLLVFCSHPAVGKWSQRSYWIGFVITVLGAALLLFDQTSRFVMQLFSEARPIYYNNAAAVFLSVFIWPALFCALRLKTRWRFALAIGLFGLTALGLSQVESQSAQLGFVVGLGMLILMQILPKLRALLLYSATIGGFMLALTMPYWKGILSASGLENAMPFSFNHRLQIWQAVGEGILQRPLQGYGLDVSRYLTWPEFVEQLGDWAANAGFHAHSFALVLWVELGIFGVLLGGASLILISRSILRLPAPLQIFAAASLVCALPAALLSYHFLHTWLLSGFIALAAIFALLNQMEKQR